MPRASATRGALPRGPPAAARLRSPAVSDPKTAATRGQPSAGRSAAAPDRGVAGAERDAASVSADAYRVDLPAAGFEGPLDLLLHLIQQHELDILDIPVSFITERYLAYLNMMRTLTIDVASEYLVMAATLAHIKSKMLLPSVPAGQEDDLAEQEEDPRAELVRRLLEYQKYKAAALDLADRGVLGKDVFARGIAEPVPEGPAPFAELGVFSLLDAFEKVLKRANIKIDHEVVFDRISITDRIVELTERLQERKRVRFEDLFLEGQSPSRFDVVITFLSLLEMCKLRIIRVYQSDAHAPIHIELAAAEPGRAPDFGDPEAEPAAEGDAPGALDDAGDSPAADGAGDSPATDAAGDTPAPAGEGAPPAAPDEDRGNEGTNVD